MTGIVITIVLSGFLAALAAPVLYRYSPRWAGRLCPLLPLALQPAYLDVAIVLALITFLGTVAFAYYLSRSARNV